MEIKLFSKHEFRRHVVEALEAINAVAVETREKVENLMASVDQLLAGMLEIDAETTRIAGVLADLMAQLASGLTPEESATVQAAIEANLARLRALGADPMNPVPLPDPVP